MNKLGIAIVVTSNGVGQPVVANPGEWTRNIGDIRPILSRVTPNCGQDTRPLIYMTFSTTGTYIAVARKVSGRLGDNVAGWIYIPDRIGIRGEEVVDVIEKVSGILKSDRLPDEAALEQMFAVCYAPAIANECVFASDAQGPVAWRSIEADGLDELAGNCRRRPYYADYCGVILAFDSQCVKDATDLTDYPLDDEPIEADIAIKNQEPIQPDAVANKASLTTRFGLCRQWQPYAVGAVGGFIAGLLVAWCIGYWKSHTFELHASWPPIAAVETARAVTDSSVITADTIASQTQFSAYELAEAVAYLETHKVWNRDDMDSIAPLTGLWDAVNQCRYDAVAEFRSRLDGSQALGAVTDTLAAFVPNVLYGTPLTDSITQDIDIENYGQLLRAARESINTRQ